MASGGTVEQHGRRTLDGRSWEQFRRLLLAEANAVAVTRPPDILEVGSGGSALASTALAEAGFASIGIDSSGERLRAPRECAERWSAGVRPLYLPMDAEHLEFGDAVFDLVCGAGAVRRLDVEIAFGEIARVLRPSGAAVFVEPDGLDEQSIAGARRHFGHVQPRFFRRGLATLLRRRKRSAVLSLSEPR